MNWALVIIIGALTVSMVVAIYHDVRTYEVRKARMMQAREDKLQHEANVYAEAIARALREPA